MTIRSWSATAAVAAVMAGCTTSYVVVPATGGRVAAASTRGISMAAYPETWDGHPTDLPDYLTPIWIDIVNQTSKTVRLRYEDFALTDQSGFRYSAISPYSGQPQLSHESTTTHTPPPAEPEPVRPAPSTPAPEQPSTTPPPSGDDVQPAPAPTPGPGAGLTEESTPWTGSPDRGSAARILLVRDGRGRGGVRRGGFRGHGRFHGGFGPTFHTHVFIGPGPFYRPWWPYWWGPYPYYYGPYVYSWDYRYYPGAPSADILRLGLPEGDLQPGGRVSGFVYFQNATTRPGRLELTWNVHTVEGASIARISVPMLVVED
jgi:hypothetical protein